MAELSDFEEWADGPSIDLVEDDTDPASVEDQIYESIQSRWPEWEPADGNLEVWLAKSFALAISDAYDLAAETADEIFATYGGMVGVERFAAAPAVGEVTWTAIDNQGYTIEAGTELSVASSGNVAFGFEVAATVTIPQGSTQATVNIIAVEDGSDGNGLTGPVTLVDALIWTGTITLNSPTSGGVDQEPIEAYIPRLSEQLRTSAATPIIPTDFERIARTFFPFVGRAVARDGWNPADSTGNNPRMISLAVTDHDGEPLTGGQKTEVETLLESMREVNFEVHVIDADYTTVDVKYTIVPNAGFEMAPVRDAVDSALTAYLKPSEWGRSQVAGAAAEYRFEATVRYFEVVSLIDRVPGVDYVSAVQIGKQGSPLGTADLSLAGAVPLTRPGNLTS